MKLGKMTVVMKDPDGVYDSIKEHVASMIGNMKLTGSEREAVQRNREEMIEEKVRKWFKFGEVVSIQIDLDKMNAKIDANDS